MSFIFNFFGLLSGIIDFVGWLDRSLCLAFLDRASDSCVGYCLRSVQAISSIILLLVGIDSLSQVIALWSITIWSRPATVASTIALALSIVTVSMSAHASDCFMMLILRLSFLSHMLDLRVEIRAFSHDIFSLLSFTLPFNL